MHQDKKLYKAPSLIQIFLQIKKNSGLKAENIKLQHSFKLLETFEYSPMKKVGNSFVQYGYKVV